MVSLCSRLTPFNKDKDNRVVLERPLRVEETGRTTASLDCDYRNHVWKQRQHQLSLEQQHVQVEHQSEGSSGVGYTSCEYSLEKIQGEIYSGDRKYLMNRFVFPSGPTGGVSDGAGGSQAVGHALRFECDGDRSGDQARDRAGNQ